MRYLNGLLGSFAGCCVVSLLANGLARNLDRMPITSFALVNLGLAAFCATVVYFIEKPTWSWMRYAVAGIYTVGSATFIAAFAIMAVVANHFGGHVSPAALIPVLIFTMISGAVTGIGYRSLSGVKASS
jgi:hypothetical protein